MNINYVAFLDPFYNSGGGEMVLRELLNTGKERGHDIRMQTCSPLKYKFFENPDITILADIFNCPGKRPYFKHNKIEEIIENVPYIHFDNAYVDICDLDYLPCNGNNKDICPHKGFGSWKYHIKKKTIKRSCFANSKIVNKIYQKSLANYFVSPLHKKIVCKILEINHEKCFVLRPIIDVNKFKNKNNERGITNLFVGVISEAKGYNSMKREYFDKDITLIGKSTIKEEIKFGNWLGEIKYDEIPEYMNKAKNFIYKPRWPEPQGRVVVEAALCGCNLKLNDNVGASSFDFDISNPENYVGAKEEFWYKLERLIQ